MTSKIEWTGSTWNPIVGCSIVSPGCTNCYAMKMAGRLTAMGVGHYAGTVQKTKAGAVWTGQVNVAPDSIVTQPLRWKKPRVIFVNSMSDLFHDDVPFDVVDRIFAVMLLARQHTYQILTKRPARMAEYLGQPGPSAGVRSAAIRAAMAAIAPDQPPLHDLWFKDHIWLGFSAENQEQYDARRDAFFDCHGFGPRFLSAEPLLDGIDLDFRTDHCDLCGGTGILGRWPKGKCHTCGGKGRMVINGPPRRDGYRRLDWVIVGGESGPKARQTWTPHVRSIVRQCERSGTPVFVKQLGAVVTDRNDVGFEGCEPHEWPNIDPADVDHDINRFREDYQGAPCRIRLRDRKGGDMAEWPQDLRVRQLPEIARA